VTSNSHSQIYNFKTNVVFLKSFAELAMPTQQKETRIEARRRIFLRALERRKALYISSVLNILPLWMLSFVFWRMPNV